jgi:hypothetical protein
VRAIYNRASCRLRPLKLTSILPFSFIYLLPPPFPSPPVVDCPSAVLARTPSLSVQVVHKPWRPTHLTAVNTGPKSPRPS